jgi:hypothetical protein
MTLQKSVVIVCSNFQYILLTSIDNRKGQYGSMVFSFFSGTAKHAVFLWFDTRASVSSGRAH